MLISPFFHPREHFLTQLLPLSVKFLHLPASFWFSAILAHFSTGQKPPCEKVTRTPTLIATVHELKSMLNFPWKLIRNLGNCTSILGTDKREVMNSNLAKHHT